MHSNNVSKNKFVRNSSSYHKNQITCERDINNNLHNNNLYKLINLF